MSALTEGWYLPAGFAVGCVAVVVFLARRLWRMDTEDQRSFEPRVTEALTRVDAIVGGSRWVGTDMERVLTRRVARTYCWMVLCRTGRGRWCWCQVVVSLSAAEGDTARVDEIPEAQARAALAHDLALYTRYFGEPERA